MTTWISYITGDGVEPKVKKAAKRFMMLRRHEYEGA